jgi:hypothetical protein
MSMLLRRTLNLFRPWRRDAALRSSASFRLQYERFRQLLALNDRMLQLFADIEDQLSASAPFALDTTLRRIREASVDVFVMVKNLNQIADGRFPELYEALARVSDRLDEELRRLRGTTPGPLVVPVRDLRAGDAAFAGAKMANLGEVLSSCALTVPEGFVITTAAFGRFMDENGLWDRSERLEGLLETDGPSALHEGCAEVRAAMLGAVVRPTGEAVASQRRLSDEEVCWRCARARRRGRLGHLPRRDLPQRAPRASRAPARQLPGSGRERLHPGGGLLPLRARADGGRFINGGRLPPDGRRDGQRHHVLAPPRVAGRGPGRDQRVARHRRRHRPRHRGRLDLDRSPRRPLRGR